MSTILFASRCLHLCLLFYSHVGGNQYPRLVTPSYIVAFGYCIADAASAGYSIMSEEDKKIENSTRSKETRAAIATFDTL